MKKVFYFFSAALICAAMAACGGNTEVTDTTVIDTPAVAPEEAPVNDQAAPATEATDTRDADIAAAAQAICNCGDVVNCVNTVIDQSFAQYANDAEFKAAVKKQAELCIANKAKDKAVEVGKDAAKDAANKGLKALGDKMK